MSSENENLKPLTFGFEEENISDNEMDLSDEFVPIEGPFTTEIKNKDSNFVFFFGTASSGKSVILATMLYYMRSQAGVLRP